MSSLPELKAGDILVSADTHGQSRRLTVRKVGRGRDFAEPVYFLSGKYGVKLKNGYTGEELSGLGFQVLERTSWRPCRNKALQVGINPEITSGLFSLLVAWIACFFFPFARVSYLGFSPHPSGSSPLRPNMRGHCHSSSR